MEILEEGKLLSDAASNHIWHFTVIQNRGIIHKIAEGTRQQFSRELEMLVKSEEQREDQRFLQQIPVLLVISGCTDKKYSADAANTVFGGMQLAPAQLEGRSLQPLQEGQVLEIDGVRIEVLSAPQLSAGKSGATGNEVSNVLRVSYGRVSFLFTGDMVREQETALLAEQKSLRSTVLKVAHHGFTEAQLKKAFLDLAEADYRLKTGQGGPELLESVIIDLCRKQ